MLRHGLERYRLPPSHRSDEQAREDERGTDELQRRRSFVNEEGREEHCEQRLEREEHRGPSRWQPSQRNGDQEPADDLRAQRKREKPQGRLEGGREVEITQD